MQHALLEARDLSRVYPGGVPVVAVDHLDFAIAQGDFMAIVGQSGSGKSTLMNLLGLLDTPTGGSLRYLGEETAHWNSKKRSAFRNQAIGFVFQAHLLLPEFTALENVLIPRRIAGERSDAKDTAEATELLSRIGLSDRLHFKPANLSGGQRQRVAIARALMNRPRIVFADEPTGALDHQTSDAVYELLRELHQSHGTTFVIVTHERELAARCDRVMTLMDGKITSDTRGISP